MDSRSNESSFSRFSARRVLNVYAQGLLFWATLSITVALIALYHWIGDRTWWSECIVVWPPFLWCLGLVPMTLCCVSLKRPARPLLLAAIVILFQLTTVEWRSLLRTEQTDALEDPSLNRNATVSGAIPLRVAVWNVASHRSRKTDVLAILDDIAPDLCFLQETGGGGQSIGPADLVDRWDGFHWIGAGDCGILSRFPIRAFVDVDAPGTGNQQFVAVRLPNGRRVLAANVHLMMPSIVWNIAFSASPSPYREGHTRRVSQYPRLMEIIETHAMSVETETVILAGDFNVGADVRSLDPIRESLRDVWLTHGLGWGGTVFSGLPLARIDHCWVSSDVQPVAARVIPTRVSDHRPLVVDLIVPAAGL